MPERSPTTPAPTRSGRARSTKPETQSLAAGGLVNLTAAGLRAVLGFGFVVIIARHLHASGSGPFFEATAVFSILTIVCPLGARVAVVRAVSHQRQVGDGAQVSAVILVAVLPGLVFACAVALILVLLAPQLGGFLVHHGNRIAATEYLRVFALALPFGTALEVLLGATQGFGTMRPSALIELIVKPALRVALALGILRSSDSRLSVSLIWIAPVLVCLVLALAALLSLVRGERRAATTAEGPGRSRSTAKLARDFWGFALPQSLSGALQVAILWLDVLLIGALRSSRDAGVYAALSRYVLIGTLALGAIATAIAPLLTQLLATDEADRARALLRIGTVWIAAVSLPVYFVMAIYARVLMQLVDATFVAGGRALGILSLAMMLNIVTGPAGILLIMGGETRLYLWNSSISFALNVALNLVLIPLYGMTGAAVAWGVSIAVFNALVVIHGHIRWRIVPFSHALLVICTSAALCYGLIGIIASLALGVDAAALVTTCAVGTLLHGLALWRVRHHLDGQLLFWAVRRRGAPATGTV